MQFRSFIYILLTLLCSCHDKRFETIKHWHGKQLDSPITKYNSTQQDSIKIVAWVAHTNCIDCNMHLGEWKSYLDELESLRNIPINFTMYVNHGDSTYVNMYKRYCKFKYNIITGDFDQYIEVNKLPTNHLYKVFLLNSDNKVIQIGSPILNSYFKHKYEEVLLGYNCVTNNLDSITYYFKPSFITLTKEIKRISYFDTKATNYPEKQYKFTTTNDNIRVINVVGYNKLVYIYFELKDNKSLYGTHIYLKNINDEIIKTIIFEEET